MTDYKKGIADFLELHFRGKLFTFGRAVRACVPGSLAAGSVVYPHGFLPGKRDVKDALDFLVEEGRATRFAWIIYGIPFPAVGSIAEAVDAQ